MRITFNAPLTLAFTFLAMVATLVDHWTGGEIRYHFFSVHAPVELTDPFSVLRLFTHVLGHDGWAHLTSNFAIILLLGPMVEGHYGSLRLLLMIATTAAVTGLIHVVFFSSGLMGASGIAFMMILLGSLTNSQKGSVPLSFLLVSVLYLGNEALMMLKADSISQMAHIVGGCCGAVFGFLWQGKRATS